MNKLLIKLNKRLNDDYKNYIEEMQKKEKIELINHSYSIATINNFYDALSYYIEEENDDFPIEKNLINILLKYENNILIYFEKVWLNYNHPEYCNFWYDYYDVIEIIIDAIKLLKEDKE